MQPPSSKISPFAAGWLGAALALLLAGGLVYEFTLAFRSEWLFNLMLMTGLLPTGMYVTGFPTPIFAAAGKVLWMLGTLCLFFAVWCYVLTFRPSQVGKHTQAKKQ